MDAKRVRYCHVHDTGLTAGEIWRARNSEMSLSAQAILEGNRLFQGLPTATIQQIAALSTRRPYGLGAIVFSQADPGEALYGVVTGTIRISTSTPYGREVFLNIMEAGDTFGEIALLDGHRRTATATATAPSELILIMRAPFLALLQREAMLMEHLIQLLCQRLRWTSGLAEESALLSVPARLASRLLSLGKFHGRQTSNGLHLTISQEELASFMGLSRQVINQYLQRWKALGLVKLGRGKIVIADELALREIVAGNSPHGEHA